MLAIAIGSGMKGVAVGIVPRTIGNRARLASRRLASRLFHLMPAGRKLVSDNLTLVVQHTE